MSLLWAYTPINGKRKERMIMPRPLSHYEANVLETIVKDLLVKGRRKRTAFTPETLDKAVAHGVGLINHTLGRCYPESEADTANTKLDALEEYLQYQQSPRTEND